jgi:hypothetical protein
MSDPTGSLGWIVLAIWLAEFTGVSEWIAARLNGEPS